MQVVFRVDASHELGAGHVMRCLALAEALRANGAICLFVCREHPGNLITLLQGRGYDVMPIPISNTELVEDAIPNSKLLGATWQTDAKQTLEIIRDFTPTNWLVVDHYALDKRWENLVNGECKYLLAIDDLVNRPHNVDIVLDQTFGRQSEEYRELVPQRCELRCGVDNVLLRPEFDEWRAASLARRVPSNLKKILLSLGGVDKDNVSSRILLALDRCKLPIDVEVLIVLGENSPWINEVRQLIGMLRYRVELKVGVANMAELMAGCDLAIGAAGTSAWERCYLGLPTLMLVLADNQREIASRLTATGAAQLLSPSSNLQEELDAAIQAFMTDPMGLQRMSETAQILVSCNGAVRLAQHMTLLAA